MEKIKRCKRCNAILINPANAQRYCKECAIAVSGEKGKMSAIKYRQELKERKIQEARRAKYKERDGLSKDSSQAREEGMTYGNYKAKGYADSIFDRIFEGKPSWRK